MLSATHGHQLPYSTSLLTTIKDSIVHDDVRGPLVAMLNELNAHRSGIRRSAYREILYLIIVALGKASIDCGEYNEFEYLHLIYIL